MAQKSLLSEVEAFLVSAEMAAAAFGKSALGDPSFVLDLRNGRRVWPETEEKARKFMKRYRPTKQVA